MVSLSRLSIRRPSKSIGPLSVLCEQCSDHVWAQGTRFNDPRLEQHRRGTATLDLAPAIRLAQLVSLCHRIGQQFLRQVFDLIASAVALKEVAVRGTGNDLLSPGQRKWAGRGVA